MNEKAVVIEAPGGPEQLKLVDVEVGAPGPGEIRIRHEACGLNYIDVYHRNGAYPLPLPARLGMEGAGLIEAVGEGAGEVHSLILPGGAGAVVERIEASDPAERYYIYRVIDSGPIDLASYIAMVRAQPAGPGQSIASWISKGQAVDGKADEMRAILRGNIDVVFAGIRRHFGFE
mgnify:CR=1 FL=1